MTSSITTDDATERVWRYLNDDMAGRAIAAAVRATAADLLWPCDREGYEAHNNALLRHAIASLFEGFERQGAGLPFSADLLEAVDWRYLAARVLAKSGMAVNESIATQGATGATPAALSGRASEAAKSGMAEGATPAALSGRASEAA